MRRTSPLKVIVCFPRTHFRLSPKRNVCLRTSEGNGSFNPDRLVKLIAGIPNVSGLVETPVIPRSPATLFLKELSLRFCVRRRLQFSCVFSTRCGLQLCESPSVTDWFKLD